MNYDDKISHFKVKNSFEGTGATHHMKMTPTGSICPFVSALLIQLQRWRFPGVNTKQQDIRQA